MRQGKPLSTCESHFLQSVKNSFWKQIEFENKTELVVKRRTNPP